MSSIIARLLVGGLLIATNSWANVVVNVGIISFDNLIPGSAGAPGVNVFDISNYTGDPSAGGFALPPDFPSFTGLTFSSSQLTLVSGGSSQTIDLGDIGPGPLTATGPIQFPDTTLFSSASFTATTVNLMITLSDGTNVAGPFSIDALILPSSGPSLVAGTDFALITATPVTGVPEPSESGLLMLFAVVIIFCRKRVAPTTAGNTE